MKDVAAGRRFKGKYPYVKFNSRSKRLLFLDFEEEVGPATTDALLGGIEQQEVCKALLLPSNHILPEANEELAHMQRLK